MSFDLKPLPDYGDLIPVDDWLASAKGGAFIPYDGDGHWATAKGMDDRSDVWGSKPPEWATHVMWFNR
jgi:hypothetical protein